MEILKIKKQALTIILLMSSFLIFFNNVSYSQVKPSKVFLLRELTKTFEDIKKMDKAYLKIDELKNNERYIDFSKELQVLATKKVDSYDAFKDYLNKVIKITWFNTDITEKMLDKVLIDLLDNKYKENKSDKLKLHSLFTEMYNKTKGYDDIIDVHNKEVTARNKKISIHGGCMYFLKWLKEAIKPNTNPPDYILEILNSELFSFNNSRTYVWDLEKKRKEVELEKIFIEYTNSHINKTTDFDGLYIELAKGKYVEVEASETNYCHFTYGLNSHWDYHPKRMFTLENKIPLINKINKIVLKGPKFNSTSMANSGIYKMDRKMLGDLIYHFVCNYGRESYTSGYAYVRQGAETGEFNEILTKKKTLGKNHYELYFTKPLESGFYSFAIDGTFYMFKIK